MGLSHLRVFLELLYDGQPSSYFNKYQIGDNSSNIIELKNTKYLDCGYEYLVFSYFGYVVKIHRTRLGAKEYVDENNLKSLINKRTKRIIMPNEIVYEVNTGACFGYTQPLIEGKKCLYEESIDHLLDEMSIVWEDANYLTNQLVLLDDLNSKNHIYNGTINIIDCGQFIDCLVSLPISFFEDLDIPKGLNHRDILENFYNQIIEKIKSKNNNGINKLLLIILLNDYDYEQREIVIGRVLELMKEEKILKANDFIESTKEPDMTVDDYVSSLVKELSKRRKLW